MTPNGINLRNELEAYAVGVQRVVVDERFLILVPGEAHRAVAPANLTARTTRAPAHRRAHEQRLTLVT